MVTVTVSPKYQVYTETEHAQLKTTLDRMCKAGVVLYPRAELEP